MKKLYIIKIGENVINEEEKLYNFLLDYSHFRGNKILIHGGSKTANEICLKLGIEPVIANGRRVTNEGALKVATMVYAGLINKSIVAQLQSHGCNSIGLCGADANIIPAIKKSKGDKGLVGDIDNKNIHVNLIKQLLDLDLSPVIASITHDKMGNLLHTNADIIASEMAVAFTLLYEVHLIYCFEKKGVLKDLQNDNSVIPNITAENYQQLKRDGIIAEEMIPKLDNAFSALERNVKSVRICSSNKLLNIINSPERIGTELCV